MTYIILSTDEKSNVVYYHYATANKEKLGYIKKEIQTKYPSRLVVIQYAETAYADIEGLDIFGKETSTSKNATKVARRIALKLFAKL